MLSYENHANLDPRRPCVLLALILEWPLATHARGTSARRKHEFLRNNTISSYLKALRINPIVWQHLYQTYTIWNREILINVSFLPQYNLYLMCVAFLINALKFTLQIHKVKIKWAHHLMLKLLSGINDFILQYSL